MHPFPLRTAACALATALALAGCGSSDHDGSGVTATPGSEVPASAQQSIAGLIAYMKELIAATSETSEPVFLGNAVLPTDETSEPSPVN